MADGVQGGALEEEVAGVVRPAGVASLAIWRIGAVEAPAMLR